ncbi:DNA-binding GntR family transcriptional regulator [Bacillus sp. SLBN-46]|uniref:GntR family transcriptional regulator n=1 Tax=Bacillus sp. SLBN-46 TaxID=3042283 RepID=UPI0028644877|nr:GntR family transcriptional regulator [Bacillus sp. SLBN-46]MDR6121378.1 DNA-binding GntR family transcriptional regulator [Bacillus sp. SLBN-46]
MSHSKMGEKEIYQLLKSAIFNSELPPGTQLVESSLAEAFGVSRTPIRSVLSRLKYESLVRFIPNRGAFVYCPTPKEAEQIFFVRQILEPEATYLAALNASSSDLEKMNFFLNQEEQCYQENQAQLALQSIQSFHLAVIEACRNPYLIQYLREILSLTHIILTFYDVSETNTTHSNHEHRALYDAIYRRDADRAKQLAVEHIPFIISDIDFTKKLNHALSIDQIITRYTSK